MSEATATPQPVLADVEDFLASVRVGASATNSSAAAS
jgi:hypothetical protein